MMTKNTFIKLLYVFLIFASISSQAVETCGFPPSRSQPSKNYSLEDTTRDQIIFNDCVENQRGLFVIASIKGAVCVTELPEGVHSVNDILSKKGVKTLARATSRINGKDKSVDTNGVKMPSATEAFTFYPVKAQSNQLILSESADCKSGKTFSATQGGQYGKPVCQNFDSNDLKALYFQYGEKTVTKCRLFHRATKISKDVTAAPGAGTANALEKGIVSAPNEQNNSKSNSSGSNGNKSTPIDAQP